MIEGVKEVTGSGVSATTITTYQLETNDNQESALTLSNGLNASQILDMISSDKLKYFVVVGGSQTIEALMSEAYQRSMLYGPRKWVVIIAEPIPKDSEFWTRMNPIFGVSAVSVVRREISSYSECNEMREGCQMRLAFETLRNAIKKVIELPFYDFNDTKQVKAQTKNRVIAEMRVSLHCVT